MKNITPCSRTFTSLLSLIHIYYLSEVFGDGGLFASRFPGYEMREGQVALARMVDEAMSGGRHALGEGPCGTGKSVGYLVPAVHHAHHQKKRVVIATANIALQEQLFRKDLPMLASVLPWPCLLYTSRCV